MGLGVTSFVRGDVENLHPGPSFGVECNCRSLGYAPNEQEIKPTESISIFSVHFTLNLPQASRLLGMTKERVVERERTVAKG